VLLASLTRERMALLVKGHLELPSDLQDIIRRNLNDHEREIVPRLCSRRGESGLDIDAAKLSEACAGVALEDPSHHLKTTSAGDPVVLQGVAQRKRRQGTIGWLTQRLKSRACRTTVQCLLRNAP
jgi:hypothetical protein